MLHRLRLLPHVTVVRTCMQQTSRHLSQRFSAHARVQSSSAALTSNHRFQLPSTTRSFSSSSSKPSPTDLQEWQQFNTAGLKYLASSSFDKASLLFMSAMRESAVQGTMYQYLSLSNLGICFRHMKKWTEAREVLLQAIHALRGEQEVPYAMVANLYREAALACEGAEMEEEAEELLQQSLHYYEQQRLENEHGGASGTQSSSAKTAASASAAGASSSSIDRSKLFLETAATHYTLALLIHKTGMKAHESAEAYAQATSSSSSASSTSPSSSSSSPTPSKLPLSVSLRLREANRHYSTSLQLMESLYGTDPTSTQSLLVAPVLASLGTLYNDLHEYDKAQETWMRALTIYQQHNDPRLLTVLEAYMACLQKLDPTYAEVLQQQLSGEETNSDKK